MTFENCSATVRNLEKDQDIFVNAYNPGSAGNYTLRVKVADQNLQVYSVSGREVPSDVFCLEADRMNCDIYFAVEMESLSYNQFVIKSGTNVRVK